MSEICNGLPEKFVTLAIPFFRRRVSLYTAARTDSARCNVLHTRTEHENFRFSLLQAVPDTPVTKIQRGAKLLLHAVQNKAPKKILITGASSGIGRALAIELAKQGHHLALTARRTELLESLKTELSPYGTPVVIASLDVQHAEDVAPTIAGLQQQLGGLDIAIANAGISGVQRTGDTNTRNDQLIMNTNYLGAVATLNAAASHFKAQGYGRLVGMSSIAAWIPIAGSGSYCASKAALTAWLNAARLELAKHHISVLSIHPGFIRTSIAKNMDKYPFVISPEKAAQAMIPAIMGSTDSLIVPKWPWQLVVPVVDHIPKRLINKFM